MKSKSAKLKSLLQKMTFKKGALLTVLMLLFFVDSNSSAKDVGKKDYNKTTYIRDDEYVLSKDQIKDYPDYFTLGKKSNWQTTGVIGIEVTRKETLVDFVIKPSYDAGWLILSERTFLRDRSSGDMYKIRSVKGGVPLGELLIVKGHRGKYVCFTLVFPPLGEDVKKVDIVELMSETVTSPSNRWASWLAGSNLNVQELKNRKTKSFKIIK